MKVVKLVNLLELVQMVAPSHLMTTPLMRLGASPADEASLALVDLAEAAPTTKMPTSSAFQRDELPVDFPHIAVRAAVF